MNAGGEELSAATMQELPENELWGWAEESSPALDQLLSVRRRVLLDPNARRALESKLGELEAGGSAPRIVGMGCWLLCEYNRAWPLLDAIRRPAPAVLFAKAECCLKSSVQKGTPRAMRRPDLAAELLLKHPEWKSDPRVFNLWLEALTYDPNLDVLKKGLKQAGAAFKRTPDYPYYQGRVQEADGDYEGARQSYESALKLDPEHRPTLLRLAYQLDLGGNDESALEIYEQLSRLNPLDVHATINYGILLEDHGRCREAIDCYQAVLRQYPNHRRARAYLKDAEGSLNMVFDEDIERRHDKRNRLLRIPINDFELSVRARNCLAKMRIETLGDLVQKTEAELLAYKNFGETSLTEIKLLLEPRGLRLGMNLDEDPMPLHPMPLEIEETAPPSPVELPSGVDPSVLSVVLADMELSVRCRKVLAQLNVVTVGDILSHTESELLTMKNFGQTSLNELRAHLAEYGVSIRNT